MLLLLFRSEAGPSVATVNAVSRPSVSVKCTSEPSVSDG